MIDALSANANALIMSHVFEILGLCVFVLLLLMFRYLLTPSSKEQNEELKPAEMEIKERKHQFKLLVLGAAITFIGSAYMLLVSERYRYRKPSVGEAKMLANLSTLEPFQLLAMVGIAISTIILLSFTGVHFIMSDINSPKQQPTSRKSVSEIKKPSKYVLELHEKVCVVVASAEVAVIVSTLARNLWLFSRDPVFPSPVGLLWGLTWAGLAQVIVVSYYVFLRKVVKTQDETIQNRSLDYPESGILGELITHLSQPEAFILLTAYLSLTWYFRLLPDKYISDYETPTQWHLVLLQLLVVDFFTFVNHIVEHRIARLYVVSHKPHHRFVNPRFLIAFNGSLMDTILLILLPLFITGTVCSMVNTWSYIAFGAVYSGYFMMIHCEWEHFFDPFFKRLGIYTAMDHHVHHAGFVYNYAHFFTYWDRLSGTYRDGSSMKMFRSYNDNEPSEINHNNTN